MSTTIENLPDEILQYILSKLPLSSLEKMKYVCRVWKKLTQQDPPIDHPLFRNRLTEDNNCLIFHSYEFSMIMNKLSYVDFNSICINQETAKKENHKPLHAPLVRGFHVVGSCHGLLCLSTTPNFGLVICNPFSGEYRHLPETIQTQGQYVVSGFGYHLRTKEYKVVKIVSYLPGETSNSLRQNQGTRKCFSLPSLLRSDIRILTLGRSPWRKLKATHYFLDKPPKAQVIVNGRLHWEAQKKKYHLVSSRQIILSLDLEDEQLREVQIPENLILKPWDYLVELRGCLATVSYVDTSEELEIWVMKEYGVKESWIKELNIRRYVPRALEQDIHCYPHVLYILNNGKFLLEYRNRALVLYDPDGQNFEDLMFQRSPSWFHTVVHLGKLSQINTLIGV